MFKLSKMIAEETLEATIEKVSLRLPEERNIILYTGTHPHEGTTDLAKPYRSLWRKYGVLQVVHPRDSTPHAVWKKHEERCEDGFVPISPDQTVDEDAYIRKIASFYTKMTISFHGSDDPEGTSFLQFYVPPEERWGDFRELYMAIMELDPGVSEEEDVQHGQVLAEYFYQGDEVEVEDAFFRDVIRRETLRQKGLGQDTPVYHPDYVYEKDFTHPDYLKQRKLSAVDTIAFHRTHVNKMTQLIQVISQYLA